MTLFTISLSLTHTHSLTMFSFSLYLLGVKKSSASSRGDTTAASAFDWCVTTALLTKPSETALSNGYEACDCKCHLISSCVTLAHSLVHASGHKG